MKERALEQEHDWQLAESQIIPKGMSVKMDARVWECTKCLSKVYLRNQPSARYHRPRPAQIGGMTMNWDKSEALVERAGCADVLIETIHES